MSAARSGAFEGPAAICQRLFGPTATMMHGGGGTTGVHEQMKTTMVRDGEPTGRGDDVKQIQPHSISTGTGSTAEASAEEAAAADVSRGSTTTGTIHKLVSSLTSSVKDATGAVESGVASLTGHGSSSGRGGGCPFMTSIFGQRLQDPSHSLKVGGYALASDVVTMEKIQTFNRSKIVERAVHACGSGALGHFTLTHDMSKYTKACLFTGATGKTTPVAARFSTTTFEKGFPDEARNPRGLAWKFYTADGNYDIMAINFPTFFVRDGALGPDAIRSQQRNPANFQVSFDAMFDFMSLVPESMMANLWFWSDHGTPDGWRFMDAYPIHTFKWVNAANEAFLVKYKFVCKQGIKNFTQAEAQRVSGIDPDYAKRDLWQHIQSGGVAEWTLCVQIMPQAEASKSPVDVMDSSKVWDEKAYPWQEVGVVTMDKNPENYHRDTEQIAFSPGRLIPGIEPTPDALLQWRTFLYQDAQLYRLGNNYHQIPVNSAWKVEQHHPVARDGRMRVDANGGHEPHYFPNSYPRPSSSATAGAQLDAAGSYGPAPDLSVSWKSEQVDAVMGRGPNSLHEGHPTADYEQAGVFYLTGLDEVGRQNLHKNIAYSLRTVTRKEVVARFLLACERTAPALAQGVYAELVQECGRANQKPIVQWEEIQQCAVQLKGKLLVDVLKGYEPAPLPISL